MKLRLLIDGDACSVFSLEDSDSPSEFLASLKKNEPDEHARMWRRLVQLAERGHSHREDEFKLLGDGIFEAKSRGGGRITFFYDPDIRGVVISTTGFLKKKQKTPTNELSKAKSRKRDYETRKQQNERIQIILSVDQEYPRRMPT